MDAFQRRHRWAGLPLAVVYKFVDDQGSYLTVLITYYGFVSLFPLLLLLVTVLGFALQDSPGLQQQVLDSALAQFPVIGDQIGTNIHSFHGSILGLVTGVLGSLYGGLGVVQAAQNALNKVWGVPRNSRPNPITARLRSLLLLAAGGAIVLATTALSALTATTDAYGSGVRVGAVIIGIALNIVLFATAFRVLTARSLTTAQVGAGAIAAAVSWQILQWAGTFLLGYMLKGATATYGLFGIVLGLLAWIYLGALIFVICAEVNVVRVQRLWPRSLLTPFTDNVDLTPGDRRAYTSYAETERHKGFENVDVAFDQPPRQGPE
ncbi:YihY/virulence factor BrkB family protein [Actinomadura sp. HBU206391]|uniref:YihY/virulence factor BrkB family protein n=1 Tax=Actinomadura sp. HBU206391 TaxID=2731692 RepID=UPI001650A51A|nr:YihY/virulence factor BrkB family protein [Actinomadura sp. HBU206391]MBC6460679.1 YihY/virulence factor BrkB family protein [Actinomadura sp. HBU206391]